MRKARTKTVLAWAMSVFYLGGFLVCFLRWGYLWASIFAVGTLFVYAFTYPYRTFR